MQDNLKVKKFGGSSLGSKDRIEHVADLLLAAKKEGQFPVAVLSAMQGETNRLAALAREIHPESRGPAYDMLLASGEQVSVALLSMALEKRGVKAAPLLAHQLGITTDDLFSNARILKVDVKKLKDFIKKDTVPLVAGFQGVTSQNEITTLGRGGSDTTAVALSVALELSECEIYTDVAKIYTGDPHYISHARPLSFISYEEMMEMAALGSRVLHCRSVELAVKYNIRIHVMSSYAPAEGTWIVPKEELMETPVVSALAHDENVVVIKLFPLPPGVSFITHLLDDLASCGISVDVISQSYLGKDQRLAFSVSRQDLERTLKIVKPLVSKPEVLKEVAKVSVVGVGMANHPGVAARFFKALSLKSDLEIHLVTTSEIKISAIIDKKYIKAATKAIHKEFFS